MKTNLIGTVLGIFTAILVTTRLTSQQKVWVITTIATGVNTIWKHYTDEEDE